jgi:hypothetical protein
MSADDAIINEMTGIKPALPPAVAGNRLKRADPAKHLAPEKLTKLAPEHILMARYQVWGISSPVRARQLRVAVDEPLNFKDAAIAARVRVHRARTLINDSLYRAELARQLRSFRESLAPAAVRTIAAIMEDPAENTAADRTVRLKASTTLLGENASSGSGSQVNINIDNSVRSLTAGIVVRLPNTAKSTPSEDAKVVEGIELQSEPDHQFISADDGQQRLKRRVTE